MEKAMKKHTPTRTGKHTGRKVNFGVPGHTDSIMQKYHTVFSIETSFIERWRAVCISRRDWIIHHNLYSAAPIYQRELEREIAKEEERRNA